MKFFKGVEFGFWKKFSQISSRKSKGVHQEILRNFSEGEFGFWKSFKGNEFRKKFKGNEFGFWKSFKGNEFRKKFKGNEFGFWKSCGKKTKSENWSFFDTFWRIAQ